MSFRIQNENSYLSEEILDIPENVGNITTLPNLYSIENTQLNSSVWENVSTINQNLNISENVIFNKIKALNCSLNLVNSNNVIICQDSKNNTVFNVNTNSQNIQTKNLIVDGIMNINNLDGNNNYNIISQTTFTPIFTELTGFLTVESLNSRYLRIGNIVNMDINILYANGLNTIPAGSYFYMTLPYSINNFATQYQASGISSTYSWDIYALQNDTRIIFTVNQDVAFGINEYFSISYQVV
jgi:hypothetical protein